MKDKKVLHLVLKQKWWNLIASGEKKEEYRFLSSFNIQRLCDIVVFDKFGKMKERKPIKKEYIEECLDLGFDVKNLLHNKDLFLRDYTFVCFHLAHTNTTMSFKINDIVIGKGRKEWGAEKDKEYFVISLGERVNANQNTVQLTVQRQVWNEFTRYLIFCEYGSVIFEKWNDSLEFGGDNYLYGLRVNENARGKGVGKQLLQKAEEMASAENCTETFLEWRNPTPQWVLDWYMKNGYEEYEFGGDSALLRKSLSDS